MVIRERILEYLYNSGFVSSLVKKLMFPSDVAELYDDYLSEVWLQICEIPEDKIESLYHRRPDKDEMYEVRNFVSVVIRNTVRSVTSAAYRKLKKQETVSKMVDEDEWRLLENTVEDTRRFL